MGGRRQRGAYLAKVKFGQEKQLASNIDELAAFEEFKLKFAPEVRKMLLSGKTDVDILKKFKSLGAARLIQIIGTGQDTQALGAIRELFDRLDGKAPVKTENTHKFQKLPDAELDAVLESQIKGLEAIEDRSDEDESSE